MIPRGSKAQKAAWKRRREPTVELYIKNRTHREGQCLIWRGTKRHRPGYFQYKHRKGNAPKMVYQAMVGPIPKGLCVLHTCDNPHCVRWDKHLYLGTRKDNRRDFMQRHPRAREIMLIAAKNGAKGVQRFWDNMTLRQKKAFCKRRAEIQMEKRAC